MSRLLGYVRVSTLAQNTRMQRAGLKAAGVRPENTFEDKRSGKGPRPQLRKCLATATRGDTIIVYKLDRIARSALSLLTLRQDLLDRGVALKSITEPWLDTTSAAGRMLRTILSGVAEFERELIVERTREGIAAARKRSGKGAGQSWGGVPRKLSPADVATIEAELAAGESIRQACLRRGIARVTFYRARAGYVSRTAKVGL